MQNTSVLMQNLSFKIQNTTVIMQHSSLVIHNASFLMQKVDHLTELIYDPVRSYSV